MAQVLPDIGRGVVGESDQASSGSSEAGDQLRKAIDQLQHDLLKLEMHLVEQVDVRKNYHSISILVQFVVEIGPIISEILPLLFFWGGGVRNGEVMIKSL